MSETVSGRKGIYYLAGIPSPLEVKHERKVETLLARLKIIGSPSTKFYKRVKRIYYLHKLSLARIWCLKNIFF